jgi:hypothetical protein
MENFIIILSVLLLIIVLRVCRETYLKHTALMKSANYARTFNVHFNDDDDKIYKQYVYNSLRVQ